MFLYYVILVALVKYSSGVTINFGEEDYTEFENTGSVSVTVAKLEDNVERIVVNVVPLTFDQFSNLSNVDLPEELQPVVISTDPAELEANRTDFGSSITAVTFEASLSQSEATVTISLVDDAVNEAEEGFIIVIQVVEIGDIDEQSLILERNGVALVRIVDNDPIFIGFSETQYSVQEDVGVFHPGPVTILKENFVTSEQLLSVSVTFVTQTATSGEDYVFTTEDKVVFTPADNSFELSVMTLNDTLFEDNEEFQIILSIPTNPPSGLRASQTAATSTITILDDEVATIGFEQPFYTFREGIDSSIEVCFRILSPNAQQIDDATFATINIEPVNNSAIEGEDYVLPVSYSPVSFLFADSIRDCKMVDLVNDSLRESTESLTFHLALSGGPFAVIGNFQIVVPETTVVIQDDDRTPPERVTCRIFEPLQVQPFARSVSYRFKGTCEHTALSLCETSLTSVKFSVTVDFLTESMENGAVGLFLNDKHWISKEDGTFDDGDLEPHITELANDVVRQSYNRTRVVTELHSNKTIITFSTSDSTEISIAHNYDSDRPSIDISGNFDQDIQLCGLCGSINGSLIRQDGSTVDINSMSEVEAFAQSYLVTPSDQSLRPQRRECGMLRNDTVIGDPLYTVPLYSQDGKQYSLCYEVFGRTNSTFNLISDTCVSVTAHYGPMSNPEDGNIIDRIGVRAVGMSQSSTCYDISVELTGCSASVKPSSNNALLEIAEGRRYEEDGISIRRQRNRVRISVPNCDNVMLVMYVICEHRQDQDMIKFVITRGLNLRPSSHGLIGQFWNIPVNFTEFIGRVPEGYRPDRKRYIVTVAPALSSQRSFVGEFLDLLWDKTKSPCLYAGNAQGGPSQIDALNQSVIEGNYRDYIVGGIYETSYKYSQFDHICSSLSV